MKQETQQLFARHHEMKRKNRAYQKVPESPKTQEDSLSKDEAQHCNPEGSISIYQFYSFYGISYCLKERAAIVRKTKVRNHRRVTSSPSEKFKNLRKH